jgi:hypothetical protein
MKSEKKVFPRTRHALPRTTKPNPSTNQGGGKRRSVFEKNPTVLLLLGLVCMKGGIDVPSKRTQGDICEDLVV